MAESAVDFPFRKLTDNKYLTLDVMMNIEIQDVHQFLFAVNKKTRAFLEHNFFTIKNGFVNDGLIPFQFDDARDAQFHHFEQLEKLFFQAQMRVIPNRVLNIQISISSINLNMINEIIRWIKVQQKYIQLKFKVTIKDVRISHEELSEFLNSNHITQLNVGFLSQKLLLTDRQYRSITFLDKIHDESKLDLNKFKQLNTLGIFVGANQISQVIPYFSTIFPHDLFKRMKIILYAFPSHKQQFQVIGSDQNLEGQQKVVPKHVQIDAFKLQIDRFNEIQESINPKILSFNRCIHYVSPSNFQQLETLSRLVKILTCCFEKENDESEIQEFQVNLKSETEDLTILGGFQKKDMLIQMFNIFKNIKTLTFGDTNFDGEEITQKINLPKLQYLKIGNNKELNFFTGLKSLKYLFISHFDKIENIDTIFDPQQILELEMHYHANIEQLSLFRNLRQLKLGFLNSRIQFDQFLPFMNSLTFLSLQVGYGSPSIAETLNLLFQHLSEFQSLRTIQIGRDRTGEYQDYSGFVENMIHKIKENPNQRQQLFSLIIDQKLNIKQVIQLMKLVETDSEVKEKLQLQFLQVEDGANDCKEALSMIEQEKHPILHQYISMRATQSQ